MCWECLVIDILHTSQWWRYIIDKKEINVHASHYNMPSSTVWKSIALLFKPHKNRLCIYVWMLFFFSFFFFLFFKDYVILADSISSEEASSGHKSLVQALAKREVTKRYIWAILFGTIIFIIVIIIAANFHLFISLFLQLLLVWYKWAFPLMSGDRRSSGSRPTNCIAPR